VPPLVPALKKRGRKKAVNPDAVLVEEQTAADAVVEARRQVNEAQQRVYEIRAEAALLVETVEDRAVEAVMKAQAQAEAAKQEVTRLRAQLLENQ
jgi:hypothetical protein